MNGSYRLLAGEEVRKILPEVADNEQANMRQPSQMHSMCSRDLR